MTAKTACRLFEIRDMFMPAMFMIFYDILKQTRAPFKDQLVPWKFVKK